MGFSVFKAKAELLEQLDSEQQQVAILGRQEVEPTEQQRCDSIAANLLDQSSCRLAYSRSLLHDGKLEEAASSRTEVLLALTREEKHNEPQDVDYLDEVMIRCILLTSFLAKCAIPWALSFREYAEEVRADPLEIWILRATFYHHLASLKAPPAVWRFLLDIFVSPELRDNIKRKVRNWLSGVNTRATPTLIQRKFVSCELWGYEAQKLVRLLSDCSDELPAEYARKLQVLTLLTEHVGSPNSLVMELHKTYVALVSNGFPQASFIHLFNYNWKPSQPCAYHLHKEIRRWCRRMQKQSPTS